jgi:hypothetical protein
MRFQVVVVTVGLLVVSMHTQASLSGAEQALPLRNGRPVVALVNRATISLDEFLRERGPSANRARLLQGRGNAEDLALLDRLITIKLIVKEAATMGLDEVPEIQKQVEVTSREILREVLIDRLVKHITPDPVAVEKLFRESVREWKTTSLLFQSDEAAKGARKEIANGATFAGVATRAVTAKTAKSESDTEFHSKKDYLPQIAEALAALQVGKVSPVIRLQSGFVIVRVVDVRYPANAEAREAAKKQVVSQQQVVFLKAHEQVMRRQFVVVNKALMSSVNYEATQPTIEALLKDTRVVAQIKGAPSVTVGDLTDYLRLQYFHGSDQPSQRRRMNDKKEDALDATLGRRLLNMEAQKLGIDKTNAYLDRITGYKESLIFDSFVQKVIAPENKMRQEEVSQYYNGHLKEYSTPGMLRVRSLAFGRRGAGEDAMRKLREGADYGWLAANAEGRVAKGAPGLLTFDGQPVLIDSMPDGLQKALAGARAEEFKLYASPEGHFYVLAVQQVIGATPRPYEDVKDEIAKKLYGEKIKKAVESYAGKLRAQSKVEAYLARTK